MTRNILLKIGGITIVIFLIIMFMIFLSNDEEKSNINLVNANTVDKTEEIKLSNEISSNISKILSLSSVSSVTNAPSTPNAFNRLLISEINVDTPIESLGLLPNGEMAAPEGPTSVSWYNLGPKPGDIGSAVIAGHYGWKDGIPAVFDNLNKLQIGDRVKVKNEKDEYITFIVREVHVFNEYEDATRVFISNDNKSHLNLITCGGIWNKLTKSYSNRLVVFTDRE